MCGRGHRKSPGAAARRLLNELRDNRGGSLTPPSVSQKSAFKRDGTFERIHREINMALGTLFYRYFSIALMGSGGVLLGLWTRIDDQATSEVTINAAPSGVVATSLRMVDETNCVDRNNSETNLLTRTSVASNTNATTSHSFIKEITSASKNRSVFDSGKWLPAIAQPLNRAELACSVDGPLAEIFVSEGDEVQHGQPLALIDNRVASASVAAAQSAADREAILTSARVKVSLAEQYLKRLQTAAQKNAASGIELDEAKSRLDEALSQVEEGLELQRESIARLAVEIARYDSHELHAPFNGTIVKIHKRVGESIGREQTLITIVNVEKLRAELFIPVDQRSYFLKNETVSLVADLPGQPRMAGKIVHIDPIIDAATNTIRGLVEIENQSRKLPAGFSIRVLLTPRDAAVTAVSP